MTDARDAEAAARELAMGFREGYASAWVMSGALDAYRDAIEKRVREERDAEVRALADVVRRFLLYLDGYGYERHGSLAREFGPVEFEGSSLSTERWLDRVLRAPARTALKPWSVE